MTHEEKINYMRIAAGICRYGFTNEQLDLMVSLYELVIERKGQADLSAIIEVESEVKKRSDTAKKQELLDKISDKV